VTNSDAFIKNIDFLYHISPYLSLIRLTKLFNAQKIYFSIA